MIGAITQEAVSRLKEFIRRAAIVGVLSLATTSASAKEIYWTEQVRLSSGEVIVVERGETLRSVYSGGPLRPGWLFDEAWLKATLPGVGKTRWEGAVSPLVLDVDSNGDWHLLGIAVAYRGREEYKLSVGKAYVAFKLIAGVWQRVRFAEFPVAFQPNLLGDTYTLFIQRQHPSGEFIDTELKRKIDSSPALSAKYKRVERTLGE
jgi:hypothetical protein